MELLKRLQLAIFNNLSQIQISNNKTGISAHFLPIETGRYEGTPREKRVCPLCFSRSIGDEQHYLMYCSSPGLVKLKIDYFSKM